MREGDRIAAAIRHQRVNIPRVIWNLESVKWALLNEKILKEPECAWCHRKCPSDVAQLHLWWKRLGGGKPRKRTSICFRCITTARREEQTQVVAAWKKPPVCPNCQMALSSNRAECGWCDWAAEKAGAGR